MVTTQGMIAIGHSAGRACDGGTCRAGRRRGLAAAISFAGGARLAKRRAGVRVTGALVGPVSPTRQDLGACPMLWVYSANDGFFAPDLAHRFRDAFTGGRRQG